MPDSDAIKQLGAQLADAHEAHGKSILSAHASTQTWILCQHAWGCWKAEEENARRLGARRNMLLTAAATATAAVLLTLKDGWFPAENSAAIGGGLLQGFLLLALLLLMRTLKLLLAAPQLDSRTGKSGLASYYLQVDLDLVLDPWKFPSEETRAQVFWEIDEATSFLRVRNLRESRRLRVAQGQFWSLLWISGVLVLLYGGFQLVQSFWQYYEAMGS